MYDAGKRDISTPYEYWIFFQLYDLVVEKFSLKHNSTENFNRLFEEDESGLSLKLKSGKELTASRYGMDSHLIPGQKVCVGWKPEQAVFVDLKQEAQE